MTESRGIGGHAARGVNTLAITTASAPILTGGSYMGRAIAFMMGVLLGTHGFLGLFIEHEHLLSLFNVDILLDVVYLLCALVLLVVGGTRAPAGVLRGGLFFVAIVFIVIAVLGLADNKVAGLLPTGLTQVDIGFLFVVSAIAAFTGLLPGVSRPLQTGGQALN